MTFFFFNSINFAKCYPHTQSSNFRSIGPSKQKLQRGCIILPPSAIPRSPACLKLKIIGSVRSQLLIKLPCLWKKTSSFPTYPKHLNTGVLTFRILNLKNKFSSELLTVPNANEIASLILFTSTVIHEKCMVVYSTNIKNTKKWLDLVKFRFVIWLLDTSGSCFPTEHFELFSLLTSSKAMVTSVMCSCCSPNAERLHSA